MAYRPQSSGNAGAPGAPGGVPRVKRVMTQAINLIFEFLKNVCYFCISAVLASLHYVLLYSYSVNVF